MSLCSGNIRKTDTEKSVRGRWTCSDSASVNYSVLFLSASSFLVSFPLPLSFFIYFLLPLFFHCNIWSEQFDPCCHLCFMHTQDRLHKVKWTQKLNSSLQSALSMDAVVPQYNTQQEWRSSLQLETIRINCGQCRDVSKNISEKSILRIYHIFVKTSPFVFVEFSYSGSAAVQNCSLIKESPGFKSLFLVH